MANDGTPITKGTTEQSVPSDNFLLNASEYILTAIVPKEAARQIEAKVKSLIVRTLSDLPREALQDKSSVIDPTAVANTALSAPLYQFLKDKVDQTIDAVRNAKASANPDGVTATQNKTEDADPVDLATGQLVYKHTDLSLDGAGIHFEFTRTYRSQAHYPNGPLGAGWDYNLNLWLHEVSAEVVIGNSGELREDRYTLTTPRQGASDETPYYAPPNGYHAILKSFDILGAGGLTYQLIRPDGLTYEFELDLNSSSGLLHRIKRIVDRFGNDLVFSYPPDQPITHIIVNDHAAIPSRVVTLHYDELGRIDTIVDYSGRVVRYTYDEYDDLVAVTLPPTKDHSLGRSTFYEYSSETGPIAHQLLSVSDADGRRYLDVEYGNDDGFVDYARVVRQRDDQGEWLIEYANLEFNEPVDSVLREVLDPHTDPNMDPNTATRYTAMFRPTGHRIEHWFNSVGNLLFKLDISFDEDGQIHNFLWRFNYNADGEMIASLTPEGVLTQDLYGRDQYLLAHGMAATDPLTPEIAPTADERRAFGNHLGRVRRAGAGSAGGIQPGVNSGTWLPPFPVTSIFQDDIVTRFTYEPHFQLLTSQSDPRTTQSLDPRVPTRTTRYEYRGDGALQRIIHPPITYPDGTTPATSIKCNFTHYQPGTRDIECFNHDPNGRLTRSIDLEGHITQQDYFPPGSWKKPELASPIDPFVPLPSQVSIEGQLQSTTVGKWESNEATTRFDVNSRGITTDIVDPRSFVIHMELDTTDQPIEVKRTLVRQGKPDVSYSTHFKYTLEGKVRRKDRDVQDDDGNPLLDGHEVHFYHYNDTGLLVRESFGDLDPITWLATRHIYNAEGLLSRTISPGGSVTHFRYDPRQLLVATTRGFGSPEASTERTRYDADGRKRATVDGRGNVTRYDYDIYGRMIAIVQVADVPVDTPDDRALSVREGHTRLLTYDALDNVVLERFFEWRGTNSYALLSRTSTEYDERGRPIKVIRDLFPDPVKAPFAAFTDAPYKDASPPGSRQIETWMFLDGNGRIVEKREGVVTARSQASQGHSIQYSYDASGRQTSAQVQLLPAPAVPVTQNITTYDLNGNPVRVDQVDFEYDAHGTRINTEVISKAVEFDAFNRRVAEIDAFGNRTEYRYDSRDQLREHHIRDYRPALYNIVQYGYDRYGRRTSSTEVVDNTASILTTYGYDDDGQLTMITRGDSTNLSLVTTNYEYDALHRRTATILALGSTLERRSTTRYDGAGNISEKIHANGLHETLHYDALNRLILREFDRTAVDKNQQILGADVESFEHDGLGRLTQATTHVSATDTSVVLASYDSLGRSTNEVQKIANASFTITRTFDPLGNRTQLVYPSGRTVDFHYDLASRLTKIEDVKRGTPNVGAPGTGTRSILERTYVGMRRRWSRYPNQTTTLHEYDAVGRCIAIDHSGTKGASLLRLVHLYDVVSNRRHDWQSGSEAITSSQPYSYDGVKCLTTVGTTLTKIPDLTPFLPPQAPGHPLSGQVAVDKALAPLIIPTGDVGDTYVYDAGGNRIGESSPPNNFTVDQVDQINGRHYDFDGNPTTLGNNILSYDQYGRLVEAKNRITLKRIFAATYDALGRRITIEESGETRFIYDSLSEIAEYRQSSPSDKLLSEHVLAAPPDDRVHLSVANEEYMVHRDLIGSIRLLTDKNGKRAARYEFDPYGRVVTGGSAGPSYRYRFMGREWDASIDLYHFRARHYEVEKGRFLQRDPLESEPGRSAYQAFGSNPLLFIDPFGTNPSSHTGREDMQSTSLTSPPVVISPKDKNEPKKFVPRSQNIYIEQLKEENKILKFVTSPRKVDYGSITVSAFVFSVGASMDRWGNTYLSFGGLPLNSEYWKVLENEKFGTWPARGLGKTVRSSLGLSLTFGTMVALPGGGPVTEGAVKNYLSGSTIVASAFYFIGGGGGFNPSGVSVEGGIGTPGVSMGKTSTYVNPGEKIGDWVFEKLNPDWKEGLRSERPTTRIPPHMSVDTY